MDASVRLQAIRRALSSWRAEVLQGTKPHRSTAWVTAASLSRTGGRHEFNEIDVAPLAWRRGRGCDARPRRSGRLGTDLWSCHDAAGHADAHGCVGYRQDAEGKGRTEHAGAGDR